MKEIFDDKIRECFMWSDFFKQIKDNDCEELRNCVVHDLGAESIEQLESNRLFMDDARNMYWKLNSPESKTRNYLILTNRICEEYFT